MLLFQCATAVNIRPLLEKSLKSETVKVLLEKSEILRSMIEEATEGNVEPAPRFFEAHKVSEVDVKRHLGDIPGLEHEVQELAQTVRRMAEQRSAERTSMIQSVQALFDVPLQEITDQQLQELSDGECKQALPLVVKLSQNLYMEFTLNYKNAALMSVDVRFAQGLREGYRVWLSVLQTPPGFQGMRGSDLVALLDSEAKQRNVGLLLEKIPVMRAAIDRPLEDLPSVEAPSRETIRDHMQEEQQLERQAEELSDQLDKYLFRRMDARIPFYTASEEVFGGPFPLADEARINSLPLQECRPTLQLFVNFMQNLEEELAVCGKHNRVRELELQFMTNEKTLYENAFLNLVDRLDQQEPGAKAHADVDRGQQRSEL